MKLFDDIPRDYDGPARHTEPTFEWLNRSARREVEALRRELERWFSNYPVQEQEALHRRFRSDFEAAFFELFLNELLLRCAFRVTVHPVMPGTTARPDFLAERGPESFYLEATLATDAPEEERAAEAVENSLYDQINTIESPDCFLRLKRLDIERGKQPAARRIKAFLLRQLAGVDPEELVARLKEGGFDSLPVWTFQDEGVRLEVQPIPKSEAIRGREGVRPIGVYPIESRYGSVTPALRNAISEKAGRYGEPDRPFIIAVNSISEWGTDRIDTMEALFGTEQFVFSVEGPREPQMIRARDGVFLGPKGPQYTRVSAVLFACVLPWNVPRAWLELYHNPWAARPIPQDLLPVGLAVPDGDRMRFLVGQPLHRVFGLPEEWPHTGVTTGDH